MSFRYRPCRPHETDLLADIYRTSVLAQAPAAYGDDKAALWAAQAERSVSNGASPDAFTLVADSEQGIVGFARLRPLDHVHLVYVLADYSRLGIGTSLVSGLLEHARQLGHGAVTTNASLLSRPLFEKLGFVLVEEEIGHLEGESFRRFVMKCDTRQSAD